MKPYYEHAGIAVYCGDSREIMPLLDRVDVIVTDPPYQTTNLEWDQWPEGWTDAAATLTNSMWVCGTLRVFMRFVAAFQAWTLSQDLIWEKQNGTGLAADRFRRVHEQIGHFYRGPWSEVFKSPVFTQDATARQVKKKSRPSHWHGATGGTTYTSQDGGPRLMRSVIFERNLHMRSVNETQKPLDLIGPLVEYSCPRGGALLDPFCGSGTTLLAAMQQGKRAIGIDIREQQCEETAKRLSQVIQFEDLAVANG